MLSLNAGIKNSLNTYEENLTMDIASIVIFFLAAALKAGRSRRAMRSWLIKDKFLETFLTVKAEVF